MALVDTPHRIFQRGTWPGSVSLRRGWARAEARPWNSVVEDASLRVIRGGSGFIGACVDKLKLAGAPAILSTPLSRSARKPWESAGFNDYIDLALMRLGLDEPIDAPQHLVARDAKPDLTAMLEIDHVEPFSRCRSHEEGNLRALCKEHNLCCAKQDFGEAFIRGKISERRARGTSVAEAF